MLVLVLQRVSSRVAGFPVASPCLWGKLQKLSFCHDANSENCRKSRTKCWFFCIHVSCLESLVFLWRRRVYGGSWKTCPFRMFPSRSSCCFVWQAWHFVTFQPAWYCVKTVKIGGSLVRNAGFSASTCLVSSRWFSSGVAVSMGEAGKHVLFECFQARLSCRFAWQAWHFVTFQPFWYHAENIKIEGSLARNARFFAPTCLWGKLRTPHSTLYTPHSTIYTLDPTLYTLHSTLYTLHFTLLTPHLKLYTPHSTLYTTLCTFHSSLLTLHCKLHTPHSTLYTPHSTLYATHSLLYTPHFPLHTPHFTLLTPHFTLLTPHFTLLTLHFTLVTLHFTLHTLHFTLYTLHSTIHTLHFTLYTPHCTFYTPHSTHHTLHFPLHISHSTLYTPHFTLYTPHSTLYTPHSPLYTPHSTLYTFHSTLRTPHSTLYCAHHTLHFPLQTPHSTLYAPHSTLYTSHFTLHTPHFTLLTPHSTLYTPHSALYTPRSTLHTLHSSLRTPHFTLHTSHSTLSTPHSTLYTSHSTLYTPHSTLYTPHFTLHAFHFTLLIPHFTLHTVHSRLHTLHFTLHTPHSTLYTPHSTLYTLYTPHSRLYTPHSLLHFTLHTPHSTLSTPHCRLVTRETCTRRFKYKLLQKDIVRDCITMFFDICTINIRVSIRVRGLHLVSIFLRFLLFFANLHLLKLASEEMEQQARESAAEARLFIFECATLAISGHASPDQDDQNHGSSKVGPGKKRARKPREGQNIFGSWRCLQRWDEDQIGDSSMQPTVTIWILHSFGGYRHVRAAHKWCPVAIWALSRQWIWNLKSLETELCVHSESEAVLALESGGHLSLAPSCAV